MHYYQHNIGDYRRDTMHLTLLEHGIYRQLLDCYYLSEEAIPTETEVVMRRLSARTDDERQAVKAVLQEFFKPTEKGWIHTRCDREITAYHGKAKRARTNGALGGRPKKTKPVISGFPQETQDKANALINELTNLLTKEETTKATAVAVGKRLPEDWTLPNDWEAWAAAPPISLPTGEIRKRAAHFKQYWLSRTGQQAMKKDWRATWKNWVVKSLPKKTAEKFNALAYVNGRAYETIDQ